MFRLVPHFYASYSRYITYLRAIPSAIDCLTPVQRRVLLAASIVARNKFVKAARIVGETLGKWHPHGDKPCYSALVKLVRRGLLIGNGNFGFRYILDDQPPAGMRYPEVKSNPKVIENWFKYINFVPWTTFEMPEKEPLYLVGPVPLGLIGSGFISGTSVMRTLIPRYTFEDLKTRLLGLLEKVKLVTIHPNNTEFGKGNYESDKILTQGIGKVKIEPLYDIDMNKNMIILKSRPPFISGEALRKLVDKNNGILVDLDNKVEITFPQLTKDIIDQIVNLYTFKDNVSCIVVHDNLEDRKVDRYSIDKILLLQFTCWKDAKLKSLKKELNDWQIKRRELEIVLQIRQVLRQKPNIKTVTELMKELPKIADEVKQVCSKYNIRSLIETKIDLNEVDNNIKNIKSMIDNIDDIIIDELESSDI